VSEPTAARIEEVADYRTPRGRWARPVDSIALSVGPIILALLTCGVLLALIGRDPVAFFRDIVQAGLLSKSGFQDTVTRMAPILLIGAGLIVAFRGSLWNLGGNGQYLLAFAVIAGIAPGVLSALPTVLGWVVLCLVAMVVGAAWTLVPSLLKVRYGLNEIVTSLMMTFIGVSLANLLIKGPFRGPTVIPQTLVVDPSLMFVNLPGTRIHIGVVVALVVVVLVHLMLTRSSFGTRLDVLGANPRAALHLGIDVPRMIVVTFLISGALIGLAAAVDMLGIFGYMRADWDPDYALKVVPLVFLARLNVIAVIPFAAFFGVLSIGGEYAARKADVPNVFLLLVVGLILLFMVVTQFLSDRRSRGEPILPTRWRRSSQIDAAAPRA
jgi:general nucleoside transport system permease protein